MMEIRTSAILLDKEILIDGKLVAIYGLAHLKSSPKRRHLGKYSLKAIEEIAAQDQKYCVLGFCSDKVLPFYLKSGWFKVGDKWDHKDHNIICSKELKNVEVKEDW